MVIYSTKIAKYVKIEQGKWNTDMYEKKNKMEGKVTNGNCNSFINVFR